MAGAYVASRVRHADMWKTVRDIDGYKITSTWIDEANQGQTGDLGRLWERIAAEIENSERLILYVLPDDFPLKGALVEVGIAIANKIPIRIVAPGVQLDPISFRPLGSWVRHYLVAFSDRVEDALAGATFNL